jgi:hypothetical protein
MPQCTYKRRLRYDMSSWSQLIRLELQWSLVEVVQATCVRQNGNMDGVLSKDG